MAPNSPVENQPAVESDESAELNGFLWADLPGKTGAVVRRTDHGNVLLLNRRYADEVASTAAEPRRAVRAARAAKRALRDGQRVGHISAAVIGLVAGLAYKAAHAAKGAPVAASGVVSAAGGVTAAAVASALGVVPLPGVQGALSEPPDAARPDRAWPAGSGTAPRHAATPGASAVLPNPAPPPGMPVGTYYGRWTPPPGNTAPAAEGGKKPAPKSSGGGAKAADEEITSGSTATMSAPTVSAPSDGQTSIGSSTGVPEIEEPSEPQVPTVELSADLPTATVG